MAGKSVNFFGGVPTTPDVNKIMSHYGRDGLSSGTLIPYDDIAGIIGIDHRDSRFYTVTKAWRSRVKNDYNIIINPDRVKKFVFRVLSESEKVDFSYDKTRSAAKSISVSIDIAARVDIKKLNDEDRKRLYFNNMRNAAIFSAGQLRNKKHLPDIG